MATCASVGMLLPVLHASAQQGGVIRISPDGGSLVVLRGGSGPPVSEDFTPAVRRLLETLPSDVRAAIDDLNDPQFGVREASTFHLIRHPELGFEQVREMLTAPIWTAEQRSRLLQIYAYRRLNFTPGAVGVSMTLNNAFGPVVVERTLPGLPAHGVLQGRDRLVAINGREVVSRDDFSERISKIGAGTQVTLTVERPVADAAGERMERMTVELTLANAAELGEDHMDLVRENARNEVLMQLRDLAPRTTLLRVQTRVPRVDEHGSIESLRNDLELIRRGVLRVTPTVEQRWRGLREMIELEIGRASIAAGQNSGTAAEVEYYIDVLRLFNAILEEEAELIQRSRVR